MRDSLTYGAFRVACHVTHVPISMFSRQIRRHPGSERFPYTTRFRSLGSECCVATGDSGCEAYTAIAWGVGLSLVRSDVAGAEGFHSLEGNMCGTVLQGMRGADALPGSKATSNSPGS